MAFDRLLTELSSHLEHSKSILRTSYSRTWFLTWGLPKKNTGKTVNYKMSYGCRQASDGSCRYTLSTQIGLFEEMVSRMTINERHQSKLTYMDTSSGIVSPFFTFGNVRKVVWWMKRWAGTTVSKQLNEEWATWRLSVRQQWKRIKNFTLATNEDHQQKTEMMLRSKQKRRWWEPRWISLTPRSNNRRPRSNNRRRDQSVDPMAEAGTRSSHVNAKWSVECFG